MGISNIQNYNFMMINKNLRLTFLSTIFVFFYTAIAVSEPIRGDEPKSNKFQSPSYSAVGSRLYKNHQLKRKNSDNLYMVVLQDEPLATYKSDKTSASIQKTSKITRRKINIHSAENKRYLSQLAQNRRSAISQLSKKLKRKLSVQNQYQYTINGFTTELSAAEIEQLKHEKNVKKVLKISPRYLSTATSTQFINAPIVWNGGDSNIENKGEGIIIGIIDSGISPMHPSFAEVADDGYRHTNPLGANNYLGDCANSLYANYCNDKLIGIWSDPIITDDYTPEGDDPIGIDHDGHGTHVAAIAAGNTLTNPPIYNVEGDKGEYTFSSISGVAPRANIIAYQVCAADIGCWPDLTALAVEHAIENDVDVLNYSVGGDAQDPWASVDSLAFLSARNFGIHVSVSAGNDGPNASTIASPGNSPWLTSVAAVTHDRDFSSKTISFSGGNSNLNSITGFAITNGISAPIVYAGDFGDKDCLSPFPSNTFNGSIVVCERNTIARVAKGNNVLAGGAAGLVLINEPNATGHESNLFSDYHVLPAIHVNSSQGQDIVNWLSSGNNHRATISAVEIEKNMELGDILADFSARGPDPDFTRWLVPHLSAPGVDVYSAFSDYQPHYDNNKKTEADFTFLNGTSMSSPHVAGALALIKKVHQNWTPAQAQSALMLTAQSTVKKDDNGELTNANFFEAGTGSIRVDKAINTGFVLAVEHDDYQAADPEFGGDPSALNIPALVNENCPISCTWTRTITATQNTSWQASYQNITDGLTVSVNPEQFNLATGQALTLTFTASINDDFDASTLGQARIVFTPDTSEISTATMPLIAQFSVGNVADEISIVAHTDSGTAKITGISTVGTNDLQVEVFSLSELHRQEVEISRDDFDSQNWPDNVINNTSFTYVNQLTVPEGAKLLTVEITETTSPDLDLYVGIDINNNGLLDSRDEITDIACKSATETSIESCQIESPEQGNYIIAIYNYGNRESPSGAVDDASFQWALIEENDEQLSIEFEPVAMANQDIELTLNWHSEQLIEDQQYVTAIEVGTAAATPSNIGIIPMSFYRSSGVVITSIDKTQINAGENITISTEIKANNTTLDRVLHLALSLPQGVKLVSDNRQAEQSGQNISWEITQPNNSNAITITTILSTDENIALQNADITLTYQWLNNTESYLVGKLTAIKLTPEPLPSPEPEQPLQNNGGSSGGVGLPFWFIATMLLSRIYIRKYPPFGFKSLVKTYVTLLMKNKSNFNKLN